MCVVAREMQDRAADRDVGKRIGERHSFDGLHSKIVPRERGRERPSHLTHSFHRAWIGIHSENLVTFLQKINQITPVATACVADPHPWRDPSPEQLIKEVNVDLSELALKIMHRATTRDLPPSRLAGFFAAGTRRSFPDIFAADPAFASLFP